MLYFLSHTIWIFTIKAVLLLGHIILITNVSSPFSTSIRHSAITDEELIQYKFSLSKLVVKSIENTSSISFHTKMVSNIRTWIYDARIRNILFALAVLLNLMKLRCFYPGFFFRALLLSMNQMNMKWYKVGWVADIMTMMYR